ncbi:MAG TPA: hypothetical protein VGD34_10765 [Kribbella sp.]
MKMVLLEDLHSTSFETLAATAKSDRAALLTAWEAWAHGEENADRPDKISEETRYWGSSEPSLASLDLGLYLDLAASLLNVRAGEETSDAVIRLIGDLLGNSTAAREAALVELSALGETEQRTAMEFAFSTLRWTQPRLRLRRIFRDRTARIVPLGRSRPGTTPLRPNENTANQGFQRRSCV